MSEFKFENPNRPLVVVVASTRWNEPPRMRHQVTRQLTRWFNVLYVEFFPTDPRRKQTWERVAGRVVVWRPEPYAGVPVRLYANLPPFHARVNRFFRDQLVEVLRTLGSLPALLFNFVYHLPEIMQTDIFSQKVYVCFDELPRMWRSATRPHFLKHHYQSFLYQHYENQVARRADMCLATHTPLRDKLLKVNPNTTLFLHGHEFELKPSQMTRKEPTDRIRAAYMGYISYRLLREWILAALNDPVIELFLIGPMAKFKLDDFADFPNLHHLDAMTGSELQETLAEMDVLIMPYDPRIPENHVQTVSNKFFQYVAAGRPVVISDMPHYIQMPEGVIYRAATAEDFVKQIRRAAEEDCPEYIRARREVAARNTWHVRGNELKALLDQNAGALRPRLGKQFGV